MSSWELTKAVVDGVVSGAPPSQSPHMRQRRLLRQDVYEMLLEELINGDLAPGQRIRDDELAERLNVSRTPVREALARLGTAGLVDTAPNRYTRVTPLYSPDFAMTLEVLATLYQLALRDTATNLGEGDEFELEVFARRLNSAKLPDAYAVLESLGRFCADRVATPVLTQLIAITQPRLLRVLRLHPNVLERIRTIEAITAIIAPLRTRDIPAAEEVFRRYFDLLSSVIIESEGATAA